jgi:hypothetical protein
MWRKKEVNTGKTNSRNECIMKLQVVLDHNEDLRAMSENVVVAATRKLENKIQEKQVRWQEKEEKLSVLITTNSFVSIILTKSISDDGISAGLIATLA